MAGSSDKASEQGVVLRDEEEEEKEAGGLERRQAAAPQHWTSRGRAPRKGVMESTAEDPVRVGKRGGEEAGERPSKRRRNVAGRNSGSLDEGVVTCCCIRVDRIHDRVRDSPQRRKQSRARQPRMQQKISQQGYR